MTDERELLLAIATEEEWQEWLDQKIYHVSLPISEHCLFCKVHGKKALNVMPEDCMKCIPDWKKRGNMQPLAACMQGDQLTRLWRAYERLQRAGIVP